MAKPDSILVLGAGELGIEVLRSLASHPARSEARIAVLKRGHTQGSGDEFNDLGVQVQLGDVVAMTQEQLAEAFAEYEVVISCNGMTLPPDTQLKLAKAAMMAGVKRYFPWQFGLSYDEIGRRSSQDLFDAQLDVRDLLRGQESMDWVVVSTGVFTSFLFEPAFGVVDLDRTTVTALGSWQTRVTATTTIDIGRVVAELVFASAEVSGIVYVAGDTISMRELADTVDKIFGVALQRKVATLGELEAEAKADPDNPFAKYRAVFAANVGTAWDKASTFNTKRAMPMQTVERWAQAHLRNS